MHPEAYRIFRFQRSDPDNRWLFRLEIVWKYFLYRSWSCETPFVFFVCWAKARKGSLNRWSSPFAAPETASAWDTPRHWGWPSTTVPHKPARSNALRSTQIVRWQSELTDKAGSGDQSKHDGPGSSEEIRPGSDWSTGKLQAYAVIFEKAIMLNSFQHIFIYYTAGYKRCQMKELWIDFWDCRYYNDVWQIRKKNSE